MKSRICMLAVITIAAPGFLYSQSFEQLQTVFTAGGNQASSTSFSLHNSVGQPEVGGNSSSSFSQAGGFWSQYDALQNYSSAQALILGWNLLSLPVAPEDYRTTVLYPTATSPAYEYGGGYIQKDTLNNGRGYWLKFNSPQTVFVTGSPRTTEIVTVQQGWNMIGSVAGDVAVAGIQQSPPGIVSSRYYGYNGSYFISTTIVSGKAYWVKTSAAGTLTLNAGATSAASKLAVSEEIPEMQSLNSFKIRPREANETAAPNIALYFGEEGEAQLVVDNYELPPVPPSRGFDALFATNSTIALLSEDDMDEIGLRISGSELPLELSWTMESGATSSFTLVERTEAGATKEYRLSSNGSIEIKPDNTYSLKLNIIPATFALFQNYPNPFNPTTEIRYQVADIGKVNLKVYDVLGREITTLMDEMKDPGRYSATWNAAGMTSGVYFYRLATTGRNRTFTDIKKMLLMK